MDDFQPITGLVGRLPTQTEDPTAPGELGKNEFLKLMMAQLQYQDPMNPMDSTQFASQLAQYSSVEELQNINQSTQDGIATNLLLAQSINNTLASNLIGKEIKAEGKTVTLASGESTPIGFEFNEPMQSAEFTITDATGAVVRKFTRENLVGGESTVTWDGKDDRGNSVPDGEYSVSINATDYSGNSGDVTPFLIGKVEAVRYTSMGAVLIVDGRSVNFGDVLEVRDTSGDDGLPEWLGYLGL